MELNELATLWQQDHDQSKSSRINKELLKTVTISKVRSNLSGFRINALVEVILNSLFAFLMLRALSAVQADLWRMSAIVLILVMAVLGLGVGMIKMVLAYRMTDRLPVLKAQKLMSTIQKISRLEIRSLLLVIPLFCFLFIALVAKAWLQIPLASISSILISWTAASALIAIILYVLLRRFPDKKLEAANEFLQEIREFEETHEAS